MIASIEGEIIGLGESFIVVGVGGVGLQVYVTNALRARLRIMERIFLWRYMDLRPIRSGIISCSCLV